MDMFVTLISIICLALSYSHSIHQHIISYKTRSEFKARSNRILKSLDDKTTQVNTPTLQDSEELKNMYNLCLDYYIQVSKQKTIAMIFSKMIERQNEKEKLSPLICVEQSGKDKDNNTAIFQWDYDNLMSNTMRKILEFEDHMLFQKEYSYVSINDTKKNARKLNIDVDFASNGIRYFSCHSIPQKKATLTCMSQDIIGTRINRKRLTKASFLIAFYLDIVYEKVSTYDSTYCALINDEKSRWFCYTPTTQIYLASEKAIHYRPNQFGTALLRVAEHIPEEKNLIVDSIDIRSLCSILRKYESERAELAHILQMFKEQSGEISQQKVKETFTQVLGTDAEQIYRDIFGI